MLKHVIFTIFIILVCCSCSNEQKAQEDEYVVANIKWGMSRAEIIEIEGKPLEEYTQDGRHYVIYSQNILETECTVAYVFTYALSDLDFIVYEFESESETNAAKIFSDLDETLSRKYNKITRKDDYSKEDLEEMEWLESRGLKSYIYIGKQTKVRLANVDEKCVNLRYAYGGDEQLKKDIQEKQGKEAKKKKDLSNF
jgi:hypothetical protein